MEMMPWGTKDLTHRSTEIISISLIMLLLLVREKDCPRWGLGVRAGHLEVEIDVDCEENVTDWTNGLSLTAVCVSNKLSH